MSVETNSLKLFYCYARKDKALREELDVHLSGLKRQYHLTTWHDQEIVAGEAWERVIDEHLNTADLVILLISPHFIASDYCYSKEMQRALERHQAGTCRVIPILLRPTFWEETPFKDTQLLPTDAKPVTSWADRDEAFHDIAKGVSIAIKTLLVSRKSKEAPKKTKEQWLNDGNALYNLKKYEEALSAFEQALRLDPNHAYTWNGKSAALCGLKRYEEAITAYEQTLRLDPNLAIAWYNKGNALYDLKRYEEALSAYEQALRLDPNYALAWNNKANTLNRLNRTKEAQQAREKARQLGIT